MGFKEQECFIAVLFRYKLSILNEGAQILFSVEVDFRVADVLY